eukprot:scaffold4257_cov157-Ochromonas_danica.AAC.3
MEKDSSSLSRGLSNEKDKQDSSSSSSSTSELLLLCHEEGQQPLCGCGCVPVGMKSLFQMAELRAKWKKQQQQKQQQQAQPQTSSLPSHLCDSHTLHPTATARTKLAVVDEDVKADHLLFPRPRPFFCTAG